MALNYLDYPIRAIEPGVNCYHSAAHNAIVFRILRFDYTFITVADGGGGTSIIVEFNTAPPTPFLPGNIVYIKALTGSAYNSFGTVLSVPDSTHIELDIPFQASATGFINTDEHFKNWYLQMKIEKVNPSDLSVISTIAEPIFRSLPNGQVRADISAYLKSQGSNENGFTYSGITNWADPESGGAYKVSVRYAYIGGITSYSSLGVYYWVNAAKQILDLYSGNMADYTPQINDPILTPDKIKFLTEFRRPTYFLGFPFDLGFIYWDETPDPMDAADVFRVREFFDLNGASLGLSYTALDKTQKNFVNRLLIEEPLASDIPFGTVSMDVWLDDGIGVSPPPGFLVCTVGLNPSAEDGYNYHSVERGVHVGSHFTIDLFEVNGVDQIGGPAPEIIIAAPGDIHNQIGINGSIQFKNLVDLLNGLADPAEIRFFDDMAVVWKDPSVLTWVVEITYDDGFYPPRLFVYDQDGYNIGAVGVGLNVPYVCS